MKRLIDRFLIRCIRVFYVSAVLPVKIHVLKLNPSPGGIYSLFSLNFSGFPLPHRVPSLFFCTRISLLFRVKSHVRYGEAWKYSREQSQGQIGLSIRRM